MSSLGKSSVSGGMIPTLRGASGRQGMRPPEAGALQGRGEKEVAAGECGRDVLGALFSFFPKMRKAGVSRMPTAEAGSCRHRRHKGKRGCLGKPEGDPFQGGVEEEGGRAGHESN